MKKLCVCAIILMISTILPACKKDAGCKLDSECPNGQICRNTKCEAAPANGDAQQAQAADTQNPDAANAGGDAKPAAKPTTPQQIEMSAYDGKNTIKLEDLGLDIDYILTEEFRLGENVKLEIAPGVTIDMQSSGAGFYVGGDAALIVRGTAESPVIFKSTNSSVWSGLSFESKNKDNALNYLQVFNADGEEQVIALHYEARLAMDHVTLDGSANNGIYISNDARFTKFTNNTIKNCKGYPIVLDSYAPLNSIGEGNSYENNKQFIRINSYNFDIKDTPVIKKQPIPYYIAEGFDASGESGELKIEPGVELVFEHEKEARIEGSVQLKLEATADNPVVMRGLSDEANFWRGLSIETARPSVISGLTLINTGNDEYPSLRLTNEANITISNITFKTTEQRCIEISEGVKITNKGGLVFEKCGKGNIYDSRIEGEDEQRTIAELPVTAE